MNGVATILQLLLGDAGVTALVDPAGEPSRIAPAPLGRGVTLPALAVEEVSSTDRNIVAPGVTRHVFDRVRVMVMARSYPELVAVARAVKAVCADTFPTVAGIEAVTVHSAGGGPDFVTEDNAIHLKPQDFKVGYRETR